MITDEKSKFENEYVDLVKVLKQDESADHEVKWANEYKAFSITPFTHTIKLESDLLWTINTDWWWHHLGQHDLVFSVNCFDYRSNVVKDTIYRKLFTRNQLPNIYNGLMYFRKQEPGSRTNSGENSYEYGSDSCKRDNLRTKQRENDFESNSEGSDQSYKLKLHQQKTYNLM